MTRKNRVLIVDEDSQSRAERKKSLEGTYRIAEAADGAEAFALMEARADWEAVDAVVYQLHAQDADVLRFLDRCRESGKYRGIPVLVAASESCKSLERECLERGAWDFITGWPEDDILCLRTVNAIIRSERLGVCAKYRADYDLLTGIYNKIRFFQETEAVIQANPDEQFAFIRLDIGRFQLVNAFFGVAEGDRLLCYTADMFRTYAQSDPLITYGRIEADIFGICMPCRGERDALEFVRETREMLERYDLEFDLVPTVGIYVLEDRELPVSVMYDRANLAAKKCKGNYIQNYAFYTTQMSDAIVREQKIVNSMRKALEREEFVLYLQPKYSLRNNMIDGAEVLVRWNSPKRGMISPGEFIPVFERNGFIMNLDFYVWEKTCQLLARWIALGHDPAPLSVNISRVSLYHPRLVELICGLVEKYGLSPKMLQLELTESVYTSNPDAIRRTMESFQKKGFFVLMDDFGSGYSSLNVLKDIAVDILKIDMHFLSDTEKRGRGENILASVIRMAKWLNMPVVAEGVERRDQVQFLKSIGCEYVQGYYYAKPMPVEEYERLTFGQVFHGERQQEEAVDIDGLWTATSKMEVLFSNMLQAVAVLEYEKDAFSLIRANDAYYEMFGYGDISDVENGILSSLDRLGRVELLAAFRKLVETKELTECEFLRSLESGRSVWIQMKLKYVSRVGRKHIVFGSFVDITEQKRVDRELSRYRAAFSEEKCRRKTLLVVDDMEESRLKVRSIFEKEYHIFEAGNGEEALRILREWPDAVNVILLDLNMPVMNGFEFLEIRKKDPMLQEIPVIITATDRAPERQAQALELGADEYIGKPFIPEIAVRRVRTLLESGKCGCGRQAVAGHGELIEKIQRDELTGLYNRNTAEKLMQNFLDYAEGMHAVLLVSIDNMHAIMESFNPKIAEEFLCVFADSMRSCFRRSDVLARFDMEEFMVFMVDTPSESFLEKRVGSLFEEIRQLGKNGIELECSIGVATSVPGEREDGQLIRRADCALSGAKRMGGGHFVIRTGSEEEPPECEDYREGKA